MRLIRFFGHYYILSIVLFFAIFSGAPAMASVIKDDEIVIFFNTSAYLDKQQKNWHVPIHVWVNEPEDSYFRAKIFAAFLDAKYELEVTDENKPYFFRRTNLLIADNERGKQVKIELAGVEYQLNKTRENGQSLTVLVIPVEKLSGVKDGDVLEYRAVLTPRDKREFTGNVKFLFSQGVSIISDIDDTVKITHVTDHRAMFENTFFKPFSAVPGMLGLYQAWSQQGASLHFVSSSPWQLYPELNTFMRKTGFPWATYSLKSIRFRDETLMNLFKKGIETKPAQIEPLLRAYPQRKFILVGDSGEEDPEVYAAIYRKYSSQIYRIYIRSVNEYENDKRRMQTLFANDMPKADNTAAAVWQLFKEPGELSLLDIGK